METNSLPVEQREGVNHTEMLVTIEDGAVVCLQGRVDIDSSPALFQQILGLLQSPHPRIVTLDLSGVSHIDSSGLATLIEALRIARGNRTELRLRGLHDRLLRLFNSTGIVSLFNGVHSAESQSGVEAH